MKTPSGEFYKTGPTSSGKHVSRMLRFLGHGISIRVNVMSVRVSGVEQPHPVSVLGRAPVRARPATADAVLHSVPAQAHPIAFTRWGPRAGAGRARPSPGAAPSPGIGHPDRALDATGVASHVQAISIRSIQSVPR